MEKVALPSRAPPPESKNHQEAARFCCGCPVPVRWVHSKHDYFLMQSDTCLSNPKDYLFCCLKLHVKHYEEDPKKPHYCPPDQRARIVGGEACMWGESTDLSNFFTTVWPDLTAVAERLWSGPSPPGGLDLLDAGGHRRLLLLLEVVGEDEVEEKG